MSNICSSWLITLGNPEARTADIATSSGSVAMKVEIALDYSWEISTSLQPGRWGPGRAEFKASKDEAKSTLQKDAGQLWLSIKSSLPNQPERWQGARQHKLRFGFPKPYGVELTCPKCSARGRVTCGGCGGSCMQTCHSCSGRGRVSCQSCHGRGSNSHREPNQTVRHADGSTSTIQGRTIEVPCGACGTSGTQTCFPCGGDGRVRCATCGGAGTVQCPTCLSYGFVTETLSGNMTVTSSASIEPQHHHDPLATATVSADLDVTLRNTRLKPLSTTNAGTCSFNGACPYAEFKIRHGSDDARVIAIGDDGEVIQTEGYLLGLSYVLAAQIASAADGGVVDLLLLAEQSNFTSDLLANAASGCKSKLIRSAVERRCKQRLSSQERALLSLIPPEALNGMHSSALRALNSLEAQLRASVKRHVNFGLGALGGLSATVAAVASSHHAEVDAVRNAFGAWSDDAALTWLVVWAAAASVLCSIVATSLLWKRSKVKRVLKG